MTFTIGVDIGGSSATAVALSQAGEVMDRYRVNGRIEGGRQVVASALAAIGSFSLDDCVAVGIGVPGLVDSQTGQVSMAVNLGIGASPYPLAAEIGAAFSFPVTVENDVRAAALGAHEAMRLAGDPPESLVMVSIGTGISAGVVVRGELMRGAHGMAGEIGHMIVDESGTLCRCGQRGCLEAVAAGPGHSQGLAQGPRRQRRHRPFRRRSSRRPGCGKGGGTDRRVSDDGPNLAGGGV